ncbi:MAG: bifunctional nuclease family protein [Myxococcota bacterium]
MHGSFATRAPRLAALLLCLPLAVACSAREAEEELRAVRVEGVRIDPRTETPVLSLIEDGENGRRLRIWIGEFEAGSIAQALEREPIVRPNPHDLLKNVLERLDGQVRRILVTELRDSTFYALIEVELHGRALRIDARPSDAIAVALRTGAPVLVAESLFASSLEIPDDEGALEIDMRRAPSDSPERPSL